MDVIPLPKCCPIGQVFDFQHNLCVSVNKTISSSIKPHKFRDKNKRLVTKVSEEKTFETKLNCSSVSKPQNKVLNLVSENLSCMDMTLMNGFLVGPLIIDCLIKSNGDKTPFEDKSYDKRTLVIPKCCLENEMLNAHTLECFSTQMSLFQPDIYVQTTNISSAPPLDLMR